MEGAQLALNLCLSEHTLALTLNELILGSGGAQLRRGPAFEALVCLSRACVLSGSSPSQARELVCPFLLSVPNHPVTGFKSALHTAGSCWSMNKLSHPADCSRGISARQLQTPGPQSLDHATVRDSHSVAAVDAGKVCACAKLHSQHHWSFAYDALLGAAYALQPRASRTVCSRTDSCRAKDLLLSSKTADAAASPCSKEKTAAFRASQGPAAGARCQALPVPLMDCSFWPPSLVPAAGFDMPEWPSAAVHEWGRLSTQDQAAACSRKLLSRVRAP